MACNHSAYHNQHLLPHFSKLHIGPLLSLPFCDVVDRYCFWLSASRWRNYSWFL